MSSTTVPLHLAVAVPLRIAEFALTRHQRLQCESADHQLPRMRRSRLWDSASIDRVQSSGGRCLDQRIQAVAAGAPQIWQHDIGGSTDRAINATGPSRRQPRYR